MREQIDTESIPAHEAHCLRAKLALQEDESEEDLAR